MAISTHIRTRSTHIRTRSDSSVALGSANPTPSKGEICYETDKGRIKFGDGATAYKSLTYFPGLSPLPLARYDSTSCKAVPSDGSIIWLTDYKVPAYCDGTTWYRLAEGTIL